MQRRARLRGVAGAFLLPILVGLALAPPADAQGRVGAPAVAVRGGALQHELLRHRAVHPSLGLQATLARLGFAGLGVGMDWWGDRIDLGSAYGDRTVEADYLLYGLAFDVPVARFAGSEAFLSVGAGGHTVWFGPRQGAEELLPASSTGAQASLGVGALVPLGGAGGRWALRADLRGHAAYLEAFDATGVESGRGLDFLPAALMGLVFTPR